jgi:hypothetical protein
MKEAESLDGIVSHLTKKHGGSVQEKGIVAITSKSVDDEPKYALKNVADLTSDEIFSSKNEPGQWICWDFREMRVRPTHYTLTAQYLKSWVVSGSVDGSNWTEIDRQTDNQDFNRPMGWKSARDWNTVSFAIANAGEFRFIRVTETAKTHTLNSDFLLLAAVEFFGSLYE